jgi:hypothetical protein
MFGLCCENIGVLGHPNKHAFIFFLIWFFIEFLLAFIFKFFPEIFG